MFNPTEQDERDYLSAVKTNISAAIKAIDKKLETYARELKENKEYLYENKADMDHVEKNSVRETVNQKAASGENAVAKKARLHKLILSPYFGRVDFRPEKEGSENPVYIGVHSYFDEENQENLIHDWRAPIASLYYDFELGDADYQSPQGKIPGEILLKRQFRIRQGKMQFMLENYANVYDDVLQEELSKTSDDKMKNIAATIQRDQNAVIRNEKSRTLLIQGVAGSGKTSIALHRIAFLLYRFKDEIRSEDILIISPNKVFADYISNVLPELGEEKIPEIGMEDIAQKVLDNKIKFQSFAQQVSKLLSSKDEAFKERIRFKAGTDFLNKLDKYLLHIENNYFTAKDLRVNRYPIPAWFFKERFEAYHRMPVFNRFEAIAKEAEDNILLYYRQEITAEERKEIRKEVRNMFKINTLPALYKDFYEWLGQTEMFKKSGRQGYEYADVFPLIYLKTRLEGIESYGKVKHLLVDEMQDYTPVQYAVLSKLFSCKKTILGDANQSVNPYSSVSAEDIQKVFPEADTVKLLKSYRSSYEITGFSQKISPNPELIPIERHGKNPTVNAFENQAAQTDEIIERAKAFKKSEHKSLGIICKTQKQAENLHTEFSERKFPVHLLTADSVSYAQGILITTVHMAKGLEFDRVLVPFADRKNYRNEIDKSMLYIACTRAMHELDITYSDKPSDFLPKE